MPLELPVPIQEWSLALLAAAVLFVPPGWAMLRLWSPARWLTLTEQLTLSLGLSMAIYPCLLLATDLIGLHLGRLYAWLPPLLALPLLMQTRRRTSAPPPHRQLYDDPSRWSSITLFILIGIIIGVRCLAVAELTIPLWGDSVHHTMIAQLIIDQGGIFQSWEPYAALRTFTYHFGFHSHVAVLTWMTGINVPRAVVLTGQITNAAAVLTLYPLAVRLGQSRWAGVAALLLAGLLAPMPMLYVQWGRYPQLAGQVILPTAVYLAWHFLEAPRRQWGLLPITSIAFAGMLLTHYRIAIFAVLFFPVLLVVYARQPWREWCARIGLLALTSGALTMPWLLRVLGGQLPVVIGAIVAASATRGAATPGADTLTVMGGPFFFLPAPMWYAMPLVLFWGLWRRARGVVLAAFWWLLILLAANPQVLGLPGAGTLTNFAFLIAAYIPAGLLIGAAAGWMLRRWRKPALQATAALCLIALAWWGAVQRLHELDLTTTAMVTPADLRAIAWIRDHTPPDARFLVNGFFPNAGAVVGSDAGWWLPLLARRATTLPPLLYIAEQGPWPDYRLWINELYATLHTLGPDHPATLALLRERGITHVYLGERQGSVGYEGNDQIITPETLRNSPAFRLVYRQDQVWIFALET